MTSAMKAQIENPWNIESIYELQFFICPSCEFKNHSKQIFLNHAFENHPESVNSIISLQDGSLNDVIINIPANISYDKTKVTLMEPVIEVEVNTEIEHKENEFNIKENIRNDYKCHFDPTHNKGQPFQDKESLRVHYNKLHQCQKPDNFQKLRKKPITYQCQDCKFKALSNKDIMDHIKTDHRPFIIYQCQKCSYKAVSVIIMKEHKCNENFEDVVTAWKLFQCHKCSHTTETFLDMKNHIKSDHIADGFVIKGDVDNQVLINLNSDICEYSISNDDNDSDIEIQNKPIDNVEHVIGKLDTKNSSFSCTCCNFTYSSLSKLKSHLKSNYGNNRQKCKLCDKSFVELQTHINRVHKGIRKFECQECGKRFFKVPELESHINVVHKRLKPLKCKLCDFKAVNKGKLNYHIKIVHGNLRPHMCEKCDMDFKTPYALKRHVMSVHDGLKPYQCNMCPYKAVKKDTLNSHIHKIHKSTIA